MSTSGLDARGGAKLRVGGFDKARMSPDRGGGGMWDEVEGGGLVGSGGNAWGEMAGGGIAWDVDMRNMGVPGGGVNRNSREKQRVGGATPIPSEGNESRASGATSRFDWASNDEEIARDPRVLEEMSRLDASPSSKPNSALHRHRDPPPTMLCGSMTLGSELCVARNLRPRRDASHLPTARGHGRELGLPACLNRTDLCLDPLASWRRFSLAQAPPGRGRQGLAHRAGAPHQEAARAQPCRSPTVQTQP